MTVEEPVEIVCPDGVRLAGHIWRGHRGNLHGTVIMNPATGVLARYYHRYARFLAAHDFDVITYDYRGIGASRPSRMRGCGYRWIEWGEQDFDAALRFGRGISSDVPLLVVGHSIGGFLPGFAQSAPAIDRMLTIGAQYAYWRDYAPWRRKALLLKWHVAMPALTALCGYFPGRRLGWLEDLPAGVALEWSFRRARMEMSYPAERREAILAGFACLKAPILAIAVSDDELGTPQAVRRGLSYYTNAQRTEVLLTPADTGAAVVGHFGLFHSSFETSFWTSTLLWLRDGINPWPNKPFPKLLA